MKKILEKKLGYTDSKRMLAAPLDEERNDGFSMEVSIGSKGESSSPGTGVVPVPPGWPRKVSIRAPAVLSDEEHNDEFTMEVSIGTHGESSSPGTGVVPVPRRWPRRLLIRIEY
jgi:hypothetical protein